MYYYMFDGSILVSESEYKGLLRVSESTAVENKGTVFFLNSIDPEYSLKRRIITDPSFAFIDSEGLNLLRKPCCSSVMLPDFLISKINNRNAVSINTSYTDWQDCLKYKKAGKYRINIAGLGDVGGTLAVGLRLLGGDDICSIGLYDRDENKVSRWYQECSQIISPYSMSQTNVETKYPEVFAADENSIFDCDMFVFCISSGVPSLKSQIKDVRMAQFEGNSNIIGSYARKARSDKFKGIFAVVSDPVDLLCKSAFLQSNKDDQGNLDFKGLSAEQIRGYGLGVMNARAAFYASLKPEAIHYKDEGRVYGPHGEGLVVADSIENYDENISLYLTQKTISANMDIRKTGFKPYIAPALSSGSLSILSTIRGAWHYSATFLGGVFFGARNKLTPLGVELECCDFPDNLWNRLTKSYEGLRGI